MVIQYGCLLRLCSAIKLPECQFGLLADLQPSSLMDYSQVHCMSSKSMGLLRFRSYVRSILVSDSCLCLFVETLPTALMRPPNRTALAAPSFHTVCVYQLENYLMFTQTVFVLLLRLLGILQLKQPFFYCKPIQSSYPAGNNCQMTNPTPLMLLLTLQMISAVFYPTFTKAHIRNHFSFTTSY